MDKFKLQGPTTVTVAPTATQLGDALQCQAWAKRVIVNVTNLDGIQTLTVQPQSRGPVQAYPAPARIRTSVRRIRRVVRRDRSPEARACAGCFRLLDLADNKKRDFSDTEARLSIEAALNGVKERP